VEAPCLAASAPAIAPQGTDVSPDEMRDNLMAAAFPGWRAEGHQVVSVQAASSDRCFAAPNERLALHPEIAIPLDDERLMLVFSGSDEDDHGMPMGAHAEPGMIGGVLFQRVAGGWRALKAWPVVAVAGSNGQPGDVQGLPLGPSHAAVTLNSGWCGQGFCVGFLTVLEVTREGFRDLFSTQISSSSVGATGACDEAVDKDTAGMRQSVGEVGGYECFDVEGDWRVEPGQGDAWPDLVLEFHGVERPASPAPAASEGARSLDGVSARARYDGHVYRIIEGHVPVHAV